MLTQPMVFARIHEYLSMATPLLWMRQPDTFGVLGLALNACEERNGGQAEELERIARAPVCARDLWQRLGEIEDESDRLRAGRLTFKLLHLADIVAVTGGVGLALAENGRVRARSARCAERMARRARRRSSSSPRSRRPRRHLDAGRDARERLPEGQGAEAAGASREAAEGPSRPAQDLEGDRADELRLVHDPARREGVAADDGVVRPLARSAASSTTRSSTASSPAS